MTPLETKANPNIQVGPLRWGRPHAALHFGGLYRNLARAGQVRRGRSRKVPRHHAGTGWPDVAAGGRPAFPVEDRNECQRGPQRDNTVTESLALQAESRGQRIKVKAKDVFAVRGEADELTQVFWNLIENALKYGPDGQKVTVKIGSESKGQEVWVKVIDQGEGIEGQHLARLTERFYRVDKGRSRAMGGTGLGLAIVKHIVARHRGKLVISSVLEEGSTFSVILPAHRE